MTKMSKTASRYETVYKFRGSFAVEDPMSAIDDLIEHIMIFFESYCETQWPDNLDCRTDFVIDNDIGVNAEAIYISERGVWALKIKNYFENDSSSGRWYIHDVSLAVTDDELSFGYCVNAEIRGNEFPIFTPHLIYHLSDAHHLYQYRKIDGSHIQINNAMQLDELWMLVNLPDRALPVVIVSELNNRQRNANNKHEYYTIDPAKSAFRLRGFAHVVQLGFDACREWGQRVGRAFSAVDGGVRIIQAGFDPGNDMASDHPGNFRDAILNFQYRDKVGVEAYMLHLFHTTRHMVALSSVAFDGLYFFSDAKRLKKELELFFNWIDRSAAQQAKQLQFEIDNLRRVNAKQSQELTIKCDELIELGKHCLYWQKQASALQESIGVMSGQHETANADNDEDTFPTDYSHIGAWVEDNFNGKLIILPKAAHALKNGCYYSIKLVCQGLSLLANEYRDSRISGDDAAFLEGCKQRGLTFRRTSGQSKASKDSNWYVSYPQENGTRYFLQYKLERGFGKKAKHVLRIYFFWDAGNNLVVVGHLPDQLVNMGE